MSLSPKLCQSHHVSPSGYIYWFANYVQAEEPAREEGEGGTHEERKQRLLELFRDDQPFIREIIRAAEETFPGFPPTLCPHSQQAGIKDQWCCSAM